MTRNVFGWSYPPGAANDPNAPYNQQDPPCAVCGQMEDGCICPECEECGSVGDPRCYTGPEPWDHPTPSHGMIRSEEQIASLAAAEAAWEADNAHENVMEEERMIATWMGEYHAWGDIERECLMSIALADPDPDKFRWI
jgi:hypothetical protein